LIASGDVWWYKFRFAGRMVRESSRSDSKTVAKGCGTYQTPRARGKLESDQAANITPVLQSSRGRMVTCSEASLVSTNQRDLRSGSALPFEACGRCAAALRYRCQPDRCLPGSAESGRRSSSHAKQGIAGTSRRSSSSKRMAGGRPGVDIAILDSYHLAYEG
jgi:hypothetical protein